MKLSDGLLLGKLLDVVQLLTGLDRHILDFIVEFRALKSVR